MENSKLYEALLLAADEEEILKEIENENEENFKQRDSHGKSLFIIAVEKIKSVNVFKALLNKVDFTVRDDDGKTAIDIMLEDEDFPDDAADVWRDFVREKILGSKKVDLEDMVLKGWLDLWLEEDDTTDEMDNEVKDFLEKLPPLISEIQQLHAAVKDGDLDKFKSLLQNKSLLTKPDRTGLLPLHKAVILGQTDMIEYLGIKHDDILNLQDNMGRTALHYAAGRRDAGHFYQLLTDAGADDSIKDLNGKTPAEINEDPDLLPGEEVLDKLTAALERKPRLHKKKKGEIEEIDEGTDPIPQSPTDEEIVQSPKTNNTEMKPVQMYISPDKRINPPPTTVDGKYVAEHMGTALTLALAEIAERRPADPVEYLANWLYKYQETMDYNKKKQEMLDQIREEEAAKKADLERKEARRQEMLRLQEEEMKKQQAEEEERKRKEQEELQRKAKEAALSQQPGLETVMEEKEDETPKERPHKDENGQTELHKLASQSAADLTTLLNMGYSPADRDTNNKTARDIAEENKIRENVEAIDNYVQKLIEMEEYDNLQDLLLSGYDKFEVVLDKFKEQSNLPEDTQRFLTEIPEFQERISSVFKAVQTEGLRDLQQALERKKFIQAKDIQGRSPLHIAVLNGHQEAVEHIVKNFPVAMKCKDNGDRTPLHYAKAISEETAAILETHGADTLAQDVLERAPEYYKENPDDILTMKASLPPLSQASSDQQQEAQSSQQQEQEVSQQQEGQEVTQQEQEGEVTQQQQDQEATLTQSAD